MIAWLTRLRCEDRHSNRRGFGSRARCVEMVERSRSVQRWGRGIFFCRARGFGWDRRQPYLR